jgi:peptidoglycan hydrolase-like protein with peptidoglycan-binding domain
MGGGRSWPWPYWRADSDNDNTPDSSDDIDQTEISTGSPSGCLEDRCTSDYITWLQQALNQLGSRLKITGILDRATINAINQFKVRNGVPAREYYASPILEQALVKAGATSPPPVRRLPCGPTDVKSVLLPLLNRYRGDIPVEYLLGWITVESGGKLGDLTKLCERGYFQVHPEESQDLKLDHDRLSTDPAYSVMGGIKLVQMYRAGIDRLAPQYGLNKGGDLFWGLVKLRHWIPSAAIRILMRMQKHGVPVITWDSVRQYVQANPALGFGGFDPRAGIKSVDHYLAVVSRWRKALSGTQASAT